MLAPAVCKVNPLCGWQAQEETHVGFVRTRGKRAAILKAPKHAPASKAKQQLRRAHDSLKTGSATLSLALASTMAMHQLVGRQVDTEAVASTDAWSTSLGLQASML